MSEYEAAHHQLTMLGFNVMGDTPRATLFVKRKSFGPLPAVGVLVGLFLFVIPGVIILLAWAMQASPTVVLEKPRE